jgi:hypothetical protein
VFIALLPGEVVRCNFTISANKGLSFTLKLIIL